jgi:hypothetical protein
MHNIDMISMKKLINSSVEYEYIKIIKDIYGIIILPT